MPLTLSTLLNCADLGLVLVAGKRGLDRRGAVRWIHSSELPDPSRWLQGHEILLTTGFGIRQSAAAQRSLMKKLDAAGCVALGIGLGDWLKAVPKVMLREADARNLPIFLVPYSVPFAAVTQRVAELIFREQYRSTPQTPDLHRQLLAVVLSGKTPQAVMELVLPAAAHDVGCVLFDFYGNVQAEAGELGLDPNDIWSAVREHWRRDRSQVETGGRHLTASAVRLDQEVEGMLVFSSPGPLDADRGMLFEQLLAAVQLSLARTQSARAARRAVVGELIDETIAGGLSARGIGQRLARVGFPAEARCTVLCMPLPPHISEATLCTFVEDLAADRGETVLVGSCLGHVFCVSSNDGAIAHAISDAARKRGWQNVKIGRSMTLSAASELETGLREALIAAKAGRVDGVVAVSEIGLPGLLQRFASDGWARIYVEQILGPILNAQDSERSSLVETLQVFLRHDCRPGPTAAALGIHRHTLAHRLDRIATLSGRDPRRSRDLVELGLALEFRDGLGAGAAPKPRGRLH